MNKIFNLTSTFKSHETDDGSVMIRGMASTSDFDRAGDSISAEAWQKGGLNNFEKNPIILFNHDYDKPIGRATGLRAGVDGLELEAKISKAAPANVAQLVKDGVLGAFSVGFRVKDADYLEETDGLMIKDAELFEVSVVSVPCNQSATFSLAKSFDSMDEYNEFKKTFTNRVDLAGQSLAKDEDTSSNIASDHTPKSADDISADQEIKMDNKDIDLEAFAKQVAEDTAAKIAMKQAEQKAAEEAQAKAAQEAEEAKALEAQSIKTVINSGVESGVEKLMGDVEAKLAEKDANLQDVIGSFQKELEEKKAEIEAMQTSKKSFSDRGSDLSSFGRDFLGAHVLGKITGKGIQGTDYGRSVFEKAGNTSYVANDGTNEAIDTLISQTFEEDVRLQQQVAGLFRELPVNSGATILPVIGDTNMARFQGTGLNTSNNSVLSAKGVNNGTDFPVTSVTAYAERLISGTFLPADTDEQVVLSLIPMLTASLARAHARAVDNACLYGYGTHSGLVGVGGAVTGSATGYAGAPPASPANEGLLTGDAGNAALKVNNLLHARSKLGSYGVNPADVAYIVSPEQYHNLMSDDTGNGFTDISEVGTELATKITGTVGSVYGSPVVVSDLLTGQDIDQVDASQIRNTAAIAVNRNSFVIPRLRGVSIETDYEVANQRTALVASQSLGFVQTVGSTNAAFRIAFTETAD